MVVVKPLCFSKFILVLAMMTYKGCGNEKDCPSSGLRERCRHAEGRKMRGTVFKAETHLLCLTFLSCRHAGPVSGVEMSSRPVIGY